MSDRANLTRRLPKRKVRRVSVPARFAASCGIS